MNSSFSCNDFSKLLFHSSGKDKGRLVLVETKIILLKILFLGDFSIRKEDQLRKKNELAGEEFCMMDLITNRIHSSPKISLFVECFLYENRLMTCRKGMKWKTSFEPNRHFGLLS